MKTYDTKSAKSRKEAEKAIIDDEYYLLRYNAFYAPKAQGYVSDIAGAGLFTGEEVRGHMSREGLTIIPVKEAAAMIEKRRIQLDQEIENMSRLEELAGLTPAAPQL